MTLITISCFLLLICHTSFALSKIAYIDWRGQSWNGNLLHPNTTVRFKCSSPFGKGYSEILDIYSSDWYGYTHCNASVNHAELLGSIACGGNGTSILDIDEHHGRTYFFIGFARNQANRTEKILSGGTCKSPFRTKSELHICDPVLLVNRSWCTAQQCSLAIGVSNGFIFDKLISASSELDKKHTAKDGRISYRKDLYHAWCASSASTEFGSQYLQLDLVRPISLSAVATQGAAAEKSWITEYMIHYSFAPSAQWLVLTDNNNTDIKVFTGNNDVNSIVRHWLKPYIKTRLVRFVPVTWVGMQCMRVEIHACTRGVSLSEDERKDLEQNATKACSAVNCSHVPYSVCITYKSNPLKVKQLCKCIQSCTSKQVEVCGSDGRTYRNECQLKRTACVNKTKIEVLKQGPCQVTSVCDKTCLAPYSHCVIRDGNIQTCECIKQDCRNNSRPVCGSDGKIYATECLLKETACKSNTKIKIKKYGYCQRTVTSVCDKTCLAPYSHCVIRDGKIQTCECIKQDCRNNSHPVCGSDGKIYATECLLKETACKNNTKIKIKKYGYCLRTAKESLTGESTTDSCSDSACPPYAKCTDSVGGVKCVCPSCSYSGIKVCGSNGNTYRDVCALKKDSCEKNFIIEVVPRSECNAGKKKARKSISALAKVFVGFLVIIVVFGMVILVNTCIFEPLRSRQIRNLKKISDLQRRDTSFKRLHRKYQVEDNKTEAK